MYEADAIFKLVIGNVATGDRQRILREINGIDLCIGKGEGEQDGQAAGAGAPDPVRT